MEIANRLRELLKNRSGTAIVVLLGGAGLLLILLSSLFPGASPKEEPDQPSAEITAEEYRLSAEARLEEFLGGIEGAGQVKVCLTVGSGQRRVYASEDKVSRSADRTEEERKYVIVGGNSERSALVEKVELPEITGAAVLCTGGGSPVVQERIYKAVTAVLGLPAGRIYVTELKEEYR
ncbi:MAG: hypothetical protein IJ071_06250 [Ruminococcus sp.]|nr:hypothetical protein [Ruminococcus sp.]